MRLYKDLHSSQVIARKKNGAVLREKKQTVSLVKRSRTVETKTGAQLFAELSESGAIGIWRDNLPDDSTAAIFVHDLRSKANERTSD